MARVAPEPFPTTEEPGDAAVPTTSSFTLPGEAETRTLIEERQKLFEAGNQAPASGGPSDGAAAREEIEGSQDASPEGEGDETESDLGKTIALNAAIEEAPKLFEAGNQAPASGGPSDGAAAREDPSSGSTQIDYILSVILFLPRLVLKVATAVLSSIQSILIWVQKQAGNNKVFEALGSFMVFILLSNVIWAFRVGTIGFFIYCSTDKLLVGSHIQEELVECYQGSVGLTVLCCFCMLLRGVAYVSRTSARNVWWWDVRGKPVSLLSETVQTMCNEQFGTWKIGVVDVIALVGACLDVFWFASSDELQQFQLRYLMTGASLVSLMGKLDAIYGIAPKFLDREGFRRLQRSFGLISQTILHYTVFSSLILVVCAINMTKFVGNNPSFQNAATGEGSENEAMWGSFWGSMLSLFQMSTMDWGDIARASIETEPLLAPLYIIFLLYMGFAVSNLFIALISSQYAISEGEEKERLQREKRLNTGKPVFDPQYVSMHQQREMQLLRAQVERSEANVTGLLLEQTALIQRLAVSISAKGPPSGEDGDGASPGNEEAAKSSEAPAKVELTTLVKVELIEGDIVMDAATFLNRVVREKDFGWAEHVLDTLPDADEADDHTQENNRQKKLEVLETPNQEGKTPLHVAAEAGNAEGVQFLLDQGANKKDEDWGGKNPSERANAKETGAELKGRTPEELATESGQHEVAKKLQEWIHVTQEDKEEALATLLRDPNALFSAIAAVEAAAEVAKLLAAGAKTDVWDEEKLTPLDWAAMGGDAAVVEKLLAAGAVANAKDANGWTPLHCAAMEGHAAVVEKLLAAGAVTEAKDKNGNTPLRLALQFGREEVAKLLREAGAREIL